jgi:hypothetical protein
VDEEKKKGRKEGKCKIASKKLFFDFWNELELKNNPLDIIKKYNKKVI